MEVPGRSWRIVLRKLRNDGFKWVTPIKILDAADYGIPQRRKRVIVLGYNVANQNPSILHPQEKIVTVKQAIGDLEVIGNDQTLFKSDVFSGRLGRASRYARQLRIGSQELTGCLRAVHTKESSTAFQATRPGQVEPISHFPRLHELAVSPTLRAGTPRQYGGFTAARPIHPKQHRCIMFVKPLDCTLSPISLPFIQHNGMALDRLATLFLLR